MVKATGVSKVNVKVRSLMGLSLRCFVIQSERNELRHLRWYKCVGLGDLRCVIGLRRQICITKIDLEGCWLWGRSMWILLWHKSTLINLTRIAEVYVEARCF